MLFSVFQVQSGNLKVALGLFDKAIPLANTELEMAQICGLRAAASAQTNVSERLGIQLPTMMGPWIGKDTIYYKTGRILRLEKRVLPTRGSQYKKNCVSERFSTDFPPNVADELRFFSTAAKRLTAKFYRRPGNPVLSTMMGKWSGKDTKYFKPGHILRQTTDITDQGGLIPIFLAFPDVFQKILHRR